MKNRGFSSEVLLTEKRNGKEVSVYVEKNN